MGPCDRTQYKSFYIFINGKYIEVTPETYVLDITYAGYCFIAIAQNGGNYWLMGDSFLRGYVTIWDEDNDRMGFVPHTLSTATIVDGTLSTNIVELDTSGNSDFVANFSFNLMQIGVMSTVFTGFFGTALFSVIQVFFGYTFIIPLLESMGVISSETASQWDDFFLWL